MIKKILIFFIFFSFLIFPNFATAGVFGYLSEFWNSITEKTIEAWQFTADWFQQVGNAVAGALGNVLLFPFKIMFDFFWAVKILFDIFYNFLEISFSVIVNFFRFVGNVLSDIFNYEPPVNNEKLFNSQAIAVIKTIPLINTLFLVISYGVVSLMIFSIFRLLSRF